MAKFEEHEPLTPEEDAQLKAKVRSAYNGVSMSETARSSMLDALVQASKADEDNATAVAPAAPASKQAPVKQKRASGHRVRLIRLAIPIAACFVLSLIVGSMALFSSPPSQSANTALQSESPTSQNAASENMAQDENQQGAQDQEASQDEAANSEAPAENSDATDETPATPDEISPAVQYPIVDVPDGHRVQIREGDGLVVQESYLRESVAYTVDGTGSTTCWTCDVGDGLYTVTYDYQTFFLAGPVR